MSTNLLDTALVHMYTCTHTHTHVDTLYRLLNFNFLDDTYIPQDIGFARLIIPTSIVLFNFIHRKEKVDNNSYR